MYLISKLLLNSLYGRFGINPNLEKHVIASKVDIEKRLSKETAYLDDLIDLGDFSMCTFDNNTNKSSNSNVAIAAFVTAYSRIIMSQYKNSKDFDLFY